MYSRKSALSQAKRYRTCPPPHIADHPSHKECMKHHLRICPYCPLIMEDHRKWGNLTRQIQEMLPQSEKSGKEDKVRQGQFRYIQSDLGGWREGYFYNPPLVLVLEEIAEMPGEVLAAQTYHDIYLAAPGDLILTGDHTGTDEFFVECWNTYITAAANLDLSLGEVAPEIIAVVKALGKDSLAYPSWALQPKILTDYDTRIYFRELETEVSITFGKQ